MLAGKDVYCEKPMTLIIDEGKKMVQVCRLSGRSSRHRALSTCHHAGIAARLGRAIKWDPENEKVLDDEIAQGFLARDYHKGFEIEM